MNEREIFSLLSGCEWVYAKTMPQHPHWYTLRKVWNDELFCKCVTYIRENGVKEIFKGRAYTVWYANGWKYWTMGAPIKSTVLINKAKIKYYAPYDLIHEEYDSLYQNQKYREEERELIGMIPDCESVLDIGCGTGVFCNYRKPKVYTGIDISWYMLAVANAKHALRNFINTSLEHFIPVVEYGLLIALFGAGSYLNDKEIAKLRSMPGKKFIMFYAPGYNPVSHGKINPETNEPTGLPLKEWRNYRLWIE